MRLPRLSIRLHGGMTAQQCVDMATLADTAGLAGIWFAENPFNRGILPAAAACAVATRRLRIGAGVFNPFNRHPTLMAMEIGALDELAQGRVLFGIGAGVIGAVERMGFGYDRALSAVREAIVIVRALLRGEEVSHKGRVFAIERIRLDFTPRADIPIYMAARGEQSLRVCGTLADGLLMSNMCAPGFAARAIAEACTAAQQAGRTGRLEIVQYLPCAIHPDRAAACSAAKTAIGEMLPGFWSLGQRLANARAALLEGSGLADAEIEAAVGRLRAGEDAPAVLDDRYVDAFALAGTAEDCRTRAERFAAAGVTELAVTLSGPDVARQMNDLAAAFAAR
jgi:5,10-methylenetetrahydromethanopterin reductase